MQIELLGGYTKDELESRIKLDYEQQKKHLLTEMFI